MEYRPEFAWLSNACLNFTDDCNLACRYCFVQQNPHYMTLDTAKKAVDFLLTNLRKKKEAGITDRNAAAAITYFGGEPTLCWDSIIVPLTLYINDTYPNEVQLSMTTNGTLLSESRIRFLKDNKIPILLSIDGAPETQNYNRPCKNCNLSSADKVIANMPFILKYMPNTTFRSTIYQPTVQHTFENYMFAQFVGFQNIFMMPNCRAPWTDEQIATLNEEYEKIYDFIIACFRNNQLPINCMTINDSFEQVLKHDLNAYVGKTDKPEISRSVVRCGLGTSMGSIAYDGSIYGCQEQDSKGTDNLFYIGNIYDGIDQDRHKHLLDLYAEKTISKCEDPIYCEKCPLRTLCVNAACPSTVWDMYHDLHTDAKIHCQWMRIMFEQAARVMNILVAEDNQLFKSYLDEQCRFKEYWKEEHDG